MKMKFTTVKGDFYTADKKYIKVHCTDEDSTMGKGVSAELLKRNPKMKKDLKYQFPRIGDAILHIGDRDTVYSLVNKKISHTKATRVNFNRSLLHMKQDMEDNDLNYIAMTRIGTGLDGMEWDITEKYLKEVFADTDIEIVVYE